jgi:hypothetical protein
MAAATVGQECRNFRIVSSSSRRTSGERVESWPSSFSRTSHFSNAWRASSLTAVSAFGSSAISARTLRAPALWRRAKAESSSSSFTACRSLPPGLAKQRCLSWREVLVDARNASSRSRSISWFSQLPMEGYFFSRSPAPAVSTQYSFSHSSRLNGLGTST